MYSSIDNKYIKEIKKLQNKKYRKQFNKFLIEGEHLVEEAYKKGYLKEIIIEENKYNFDVKKTYVTKNVLKYLSELENTNIIGICEMKENKLKGNRLVILDNVQDPGNLGTIIRSCVAFNIDTLVLINSVDQYNSKVLRSSQGLNFHLNIVNSDYDILNEIKKDYYIYGTDVNDGNSLKTIAKNQKFAIIMGNEGSGLSNNVKKLCDEFIYIKTSHLCESLNVGVATSIILYELGD